MGRNDLWKNAKTTLLHLIGKRSRGSRLLAKLIWPQTCLLVVPTAWPIAVLVVPALVVATGVLLHGVWKISLARGMPAGLLENKPDVSSPEDKVQESKDLKEDQSKWVDRLERKLRKISISEKSFKRKRSLFTSMQGLLPVSGVKSLVHLECMTFHEGLLCVWQTGNEMVGWHHWLCGRECEQTLWDSEGQGSPACCSPWGHKELDTTSWVNNNRRTLCASIHLVMEGAIIVILKMWKQVQQKNKQFFYGHMTG